MGSPDRYCVIFNLFRSCPKLEEEGCEVYAVGQCQQAGEFGTVGLTIENTIHAQNNAEARRLAREEIEKSASDHEFSAGNCKDFVLLCDFQPEISAPPILINSHPKVIKVRHQFTGIT